MQSVSHGQNYEIEYKFIHSPFDVRVTLVRSIKFAAGLPHTQQKKDSTKMVVDHFSNMTYCILYHKTMDFLHIANRYFKDLARLLNLLKINTSN